MGYSPDWQKQSYAKGNSTPKVTQKGNIVRNELFHNAPSRLGLADGGDVTEEQLKKEGLAISNKEREDRRANMSAGERFKDGASSLWERLKAGNIDSPNSEAYYKYGAGRARAERDKVRDSAAVEAGMANRGDNTDEFASGRKAMMGDAASVARVESARESNPTDKGVTDEPQKSKIYKAEPAEVRPYKPEPMPEPKPLKDRTTEVVRSRKPVTRDSSVAKDMKPASQTFSLTDNRDLPSKPYPLETSQKFQTQSDNDMLGRRQEGVGYKSGASNTKPASSEPKTKRVQVGTSRAGTPVYKDVPSDEAVASARAALSERIKKQDEENRKVPIVKALRGEGARTRAGTPVK